MMEARDERFKAAVKRIEAEHQHIYDAAKSSQRGATCLRCSGLQAELTALRSVLVTICNLVGGQASPDVSSEFLAHVPDEAEAFITRLREDKARLDYMESHCSVMRLEPEAFGFNDVRGRIDQVRGKS